MNHFLPLSRLLVFDNQAVKYVVLQTRVIIGYVQTVYCAGKYGGAHEKAVLSEII